MRINPFPGQTPLWLGGLAQPVAQARRAKCNSEKFNHNTCSYNGDKIGGCVKADGTVCVYKNNTLLTTITLNGADQSFFNAKGGRIGLWTVAAFNAFFDDFGGGALPGVTGAARGENTVPDEVADDGTAITVAVAFPLDVVAPAVPDNTADNTEAGTLINRAFLPLVSR